MQPLYHKERLLAALRMHRLDALIATTRENIYYLTGFMPVVKTLRPYRGHCYAIITGEQQGAAVHIIHSIGEADQILDARGTIGQTAFYGTFFREYHQGSLLPDEQRLIDMCAPDNVFPTPTQAMEAQLQRLGLLTGIIGIDQDGMTAEDFRTMTSVAATAQWRPAAEIFRWIRRVKTSPELELLSASARALESAYASAAARAVVGSSECDIANALELSLIAAGARPALTMLKIGRHAVGGQRRQRADICLQASDSIWFDCDATYAGYWSDIARVYTIGDGAVDRHRHAALLQGQRKAIDNIRPGMTGGDVFKLTMDGVHAAGFPEYRRHHVGHGIGLEPYEAPILSPDSTDVIEAGCVISVETPYYEYGVGALHIEDPIVVGQDGNERLTLDDGELARIGR